MFQKEKISSLAEEIFYCCYEHLDVVGTIEDCSGEVFTAAAFSVKDGYIILNQLSAFLFVGEEEKGIAFLVEKEEDFREFPGKASAYLD